MRQIVWRIFLLLFGEKVVSLLELTQKHYEKTERRSCIQ